MAVLSDAQITALANLHSHDLANFIPPSASSESSTSAQLAEEVYFWSRVQALGPNSNATAIAGAKVTAVTAKQLAHGIVVNEVAGGLHYAGTTQSVKY